MFLMKKEKNLLPEEFYNNYDFKDLKQKIKNKFKKFTEIHSSCKFPLSYYNKTTPYIIFYKSVTDNKSKFQTTINQLWGINFYNAIINLADKFTLTEVIYFVDTFFKNKSETFIAQKVGMNQKGLSSIKKSCLVKTWLEIKELD